jgi:hypothetical protein
VVAPEVQLAVDQRVSVGVAREAVHIFSARDGMRVELQGAGSRES